MLTIGVGVEGPSDRLFWGKCLHRCLPGVRFDIHNMSNRERLIRDAGRLLGLFRSLQYGGGLIILDCDSDPCVATIRSRFDEDIRAEMQRPVGDRFLLLCVAVKALESWLLADDVAIKKVFSRAPYDPPGETSTLGKGRLRRVWKDHFGEHASFNELEAARVLAPVFDPERAMQRSTSFCLVWSRITTRASAPRTTPLLDG